MNKVLLPFAGLVVLLSLFLPASGEPDSCPDPVLPKDGEVYHPAFPWGDRNHADGYEYVKANTVHDVPALEFLMVYHGIAKCDPDEAIELLNGPDYWAMHDCPPPACKLEPLRIRYDYVEANFSFGVSTREFLSVYHEIANNDPYEAIRIFNDPDYPDAYKEQFAAIAKREPPVWPPFTPQGQIPIAILGFVVIGMAAFMIMQRVLR